MDEARSCTVCGCALNSGHDVCPLCGAPVPSQAPSIAPDSRGRHVRMPEAGLLARPRRIAVFGVVAVIAVAAVVAIAFVWIGDRDLHDLANGATSSEGVAAVASAPAESFTSESGNVAAGGIVAASGEWLYEASTDGVFYRSLSSSEEPARRLAGEGAYDLNVCGDRVFYLEADSGGRSAFEGVAIRSTEVPTRGEGGPQASEVVYKPADSTACLSCLVSQGDCLYFLERANLRYEVKSLEANGSEAASVASVDRAERAWLFADGDVLYVVVSDDASWSVRRLDASSSSGALSEVAKGSGSLAAATISKGKLYYAVVSGSSDVHLQRSDLKGGVIEYADVVNPIGIAASGDVVAVVTKGGQLIWVDAVTSVAHDLTDRLRGMSPNFVAMSAALGVCGEWVCVADGRDGFYSMSVNGSEDRAAV